MLHESRAKLASEKLLLLTEALFDAVANDRVDEIEGILQSRQIVLDELNKSTLDSQALSILQKVAESEEAVLAVMERAAASTTKEMIQILSGPKSLRAYTTPSQASFIRAS